MELGGARACSNCNNNFSWEYTTPDTENILNIDDKDLAIASVRLINSKEEQYDITVKCPKCKSLNKFSIIAPWHNKE